MRKLFTACLTVGFIAASGIAIFNGFIARPSNTYAGATSIAQQMTAAPATAAATLALSASVEESSPTEPATATADPSAEIPTSTETAEPIEPTSPAENTEEALPTAIVIGAPYPIPPTLINGVAIESLVSIPDVNTIRAIFAAGQELGRDPRSFSKLGDSTIENPHFLSRFDQPGSYNLGDWDYLQPMIDFYQGSFGRQGMAVHRGLHSWSVLDPMWADPLNCLAREDMLACEIRLHNPSVLFIRLGSNDVGIPDEVDQDLRAIVEFCIENGVIPLLGTKADRHEGRDNANNNIIRQIAADYALPLWDFDAVADTLPGRGMANDGVHLTTFFATDYSQPGAFTRGYPVHNLLALIMLDSVWRAVMTP
jgi:hypothetical protein